MQNITQRYLPLLLIVIFPAFIRFNKLAVNPPALFADEVDIGYQVKSFLSTGRDYYGNSFPLQFRSFSDVRTALPIYATVIVSRLPGISIDTAIRLTPAIFSLLSILGIFFLANQLLVVFDLCKNKNSSPAGLWASLFLALTPWHFTYSRIGFELSMLFAFFIWGLFFYFRGLNSKKLGLLLASDVLLGLMPLIYSTAKLSILFIPFLILSLPSRLRPKLFSRDNLLFHLILTIPLVLIVVSGGAAQRFSELAIHTDPTLFPEVNFSRQADLGPNLIVGSSPNIESKLAHNRPLMILTAFAKNIFGPVSFNYLFVAGDKNLRHAVSGWGMLLKLVAIPLLFGIYLAFRQKESHLARFLLVLALLAILPSALTRDGAAHSSRTYLLLLPLTITIAIGFQSIFSSRKSAALLLLLAICFEFFLYQHDYWFHYRYLSERLWDSGMKEMILESNKYPEKIKVISRTFEPPLIFFLYYSDFPADQFQQLVKKGNYLTPIDGELNLEGVRFADLPIYFASIRDSHAKNPLVLRDAVYFLSQGEVKNIFSGLPPSDVSVIRLPSNEPLFYRLITKN